MVCSTFSRSGWSVVRSASVAKGCTSKKRPSTHFHKVPTRSSNKVSPRTFQTALVYEGYRIMKLRRRTKLRKRKEQEAGDKYI
jgi:hypothetical protein